MTATKPLEERLREWLGEDGKDFFSGLMRDHGTLLAVFPLRLANGSSIPYSVHFRDGMMVRNWLRSQPECQGWDAHKYDDEWADLVKKALGL